MVQAIIFVGYILSLLKNVRVVRPFAADVKFTVNIIATFTVNSTRLPIKCSTVCERCGRALRRLPRTGGVHREIKINVNVLFTMKCSHNKFPVKGYVIFFTANIKIIHHIRYIQGERFTTNAAHSPTRSPCSRRMVRGELCSFADAFTRTPGKPAGANVFSTQRHSPRTF